jgi:hypothetical protein
MIVALALNLLVVALVAWRVKARWQVRLAVAVAASAALSLALRVPEIFMGDPNEVSSSVTAKTLVGPSERVRLEGAEEIYYRRTNEPPSWGMRADWSVGLRRLETVHENPHSILRNLGISSGPGAGGRVILRVHTEETLGILTVTAEVLDGGVVKATYRQRVRRSYPLEEFDEMGYFPRGGGLALLLAFTQDTFWIPKREFAADGSHPIADFLAAALAPAGIGPGGTLVPPVAEALSTSGKLMRVTAQVFPTPVPGNEIPANVGFCDRRDGIHEFYLDLSSSYIRWKETDVAEMRFDRGLDAASLYCGEPANVAWFAAYRDGRVNLWAYRFGFDTRSSRVEAWLQAELPADSRALLDAVKPRRLQIARIGEHTAELYLVKLDKLGRGKYGPTQGYRIELPLR